MVLLGSKPQQKVWIAEVPYFLKNVGWSILPLIGLTSTTKEKLLINRPLGLSMERSTTKQVFKKFWRLVRGDRRLVRVSISIWTIAMSDEGKIFVFFLTNHCYNHLCHSHNHSCHSYHHSHHNHHQSHHHSHHHRHHHHHHSPWRYHSHH